MMAALANKKVEYNEIPNQSANLSLIEDGSTINFKPVGISNDAFDSRRTLIKQEDPVVSGSYQEQ